MVRLNIPENKVFIIEYVLKNVFDFIHPNYLVFILRIKKKKHVLMPLNVPEKVKSSLKIVRYEAVFLF